MSWGKNSFFVAYIEHTIRMSTFWAHQRQGVDIRKFGVQQRIHLRRHWQYMRTVCIVFSHELIVPLLNEAKG